MVAETAGRIAEMGEKRNYRKEGCWNSWKGCWNGWNDWRRVAETAKELLKRVKRETTEKRGAETAERVAETAEEELLKQVKREMAEKRVTEVAETAERIAETGEKRA